MALLLLLTAFSFLACLVSADTCVSKPCGSDYQVTSWNPIREGSWSVYYYEVKADGCGVVFTDVLLQMSLSCRDCSTIKCYDSNWNVKRCPSTPSWVTSDSFLTSKGVSVTSGLKWVLPKSTILRFSISTNPATTTSAQGKLYTKGNSWAYCRVTTPVCNCNVCPPCPDRCYKPYPNTCSCSNCTDCVGMTYEVSPCNATSNRICEPCTQCVNGTTYETRSCSQNTNRLCTNCTRCVTNTTYETVPCTTTRNRVCQTCTQCVTNMTYETRPCNTTTNRICNPCTQCVTNMTYQTVPCTTTRNRVCQNCTQCVTNMTYEVRPCNSTTDRLCTSCSQCVNNMTYETVPCTTTRNRVCQNCTQCVTNMTYETVPCNTTTNRVCANCQQCVTNMTYETVPCSTTTNRVCQNCTQCISGESYETVPCTAVSDRVCTTCSNCSAGEQMVTPCNATHDVVCEPCPQCANCTDPNAHLGNNGLNCTCNDGFMEDPNSETFRCVPTPCCQDCQECGFNASMPCFLHDSATCDYSCKLAAECRLGTTPFETGYTVSYIESTVDGPCCGTGNGDCTCFSYTLAASNSFPLDDFILGLTCPELQRCDGGLTLPPCVDSVLRDGNPINFFITTPAERDPYTDLYGILLTGQGIQNDAFTYTIVFQGHVNESSIPITYSAGTQSQSSEDRTCLVDSIIGPDCVDCSTNPDRVFGLKKTLQSLTEMEGEDELIESDNAGSANGSGLMVIILTIFNLFALMGAIRK